MKVDERQVPHWDELDEKTKHRLLGRCWMRVKRKCKRLRKDFDRDAYIRCLQIETAEHLALIKKPKKEVTAKQVEEYRKELSEKESSDFWENEDDEEIRILKRIFRDPDWERKKKEENEALKRWIEEQLK